MPQSTLRLLLLLLSGLMLLTACGGEAATPAPVQDTAPTAAQPTDDAAPASPAPTATPSPLPEPTEALAALVNGEAITLADFTAVLQREEARLAEGNVVPADRAAFEESVLNLMIDQLLIEQAAALQGLTVTEAELDAEIQLDLEVAGGEANWRAWLEQNFFTEAEYRESIRSALLTAKIRDQVTANVPTAVTQAHARHILVSTEAEANELYQLLLNGADFAQLAFEHSRDVTTRELGGDLGWFAADQLSVQVVTETVFALEPGQISEPVASRLGYHLIQTLEIVPDRPLDDVARAQLLGNTFDRWRQSLWEQADIQVFI